MNWYLEMLKQYVISGGQVPSREYWMFTLLAFIIGCVLGFVGCVLGFVEILVGGPGFVVFIGLCGLAVLIPSIALSVSAINGANRSGWWLLISLIPFIGSIILLGFVAQDNQSNENQCRCNPKDAAA